MDAPSNGQPSPGDPVPPVPAVAPSPDPPSPPLPRPSSLGFFAVVLGLFAALGTAAQASSAVLGLAWSEVFALLVPALVAATGSNLRPARALLLSPRPRAAVVALAVGVGVAGFLAAGALMALSSLVLPVRWVELFDVTRIFERPLGQRIALAVVASTLAPFCEEVAFRGWLLTTLRIRYRAPVAISCAALLFALMHLDPVRLVALVGLGAVYGWLAWRAGSVWPAFAAHATNNAIGVLLASSGVAGNGTLAARAEPGQIAASAALTLALSGGVLSVVLGAYARAAGQAPALADALAPVHPASGTVRFDSRRVPPRLLAVAVLGGVLLVALLAIGHATRR